MGCGASNSRAGGADGAASSPSSSLWEAPSSSSGRGLPPPGASSSNRKGGACEGGGVTEHVASHALSPSGRGEGVRERAFSGAAAAGTRNPSGSPTPNSFEASSKELVSPSTSRGWAGGAQAGTPPTGIGSPVDSSVNGAEAFEVGEVALISVENLVLGMGGSVSFTVDGEKSHIKDVFATSAVVPPDAAVSAWPLGRVPLSNPPYITGFKVKPIV